MGSVGIAVSRDEKTRDVVLAHVSDGLGVRYELVDHAFVATGRGRHGNWSGVMYALVRDRSTGELLMDLYLHLRARETQFRSSEVVIKAVSETSGPVEHCGVPMRMLNALSDPANDWAAQWRRNAEKWHERRKAAHAAVGKTVRLPYSLSYREVSTDVFTVVSMNRFASNDPGLVGLTLRAPARWWEAGLEVLTHDEAATT